MGPHHHAAGLRGAVLIAPLEARASVLHHTNLGGCGLTGLPVSFQALRKLPPKVRGRKRHKVSPRRAEAGSTCVAARGWWPR